MCLISIVIPFYNAAQYIRECVESALTQTLDDVEVICVDDCSTDNSREIVESIVDPRMRVIGFSQNQGVSSTRNAGLRAARGEYVYFLDSDDWIEPGYLETMVSYARSGKVEIVLNPNVEPSMRGISCSKPTRYPSRLVATYAYPSVWTRLYRRKYLIDNSVVFPEELSASEDYFFTKLAESLTDYTFVVPGPAYHHTIRAGSLSTRNTFDNIRASKLLYDEMRRRGISTEGFKLFYAGHILLNSADRFDFTRSFFKEIESGVKREPDLYVPFDMFCFEAVLSCETYDAFCKAYNPNLSISFVNKRLGRE